MRYWVLASLLLASIAARAGDCVPVAGIIPVCRIQAPEDLELSPDGKYLLMSQFAGLSASGAGGIALFDLQTSQHEVLYPRPGADGRPDWGSDDCPGSPGEQLSSHGIHLSQRDDGVWQLLVVNHGGRESVEFFELQSIVGKPSLVWRGCVVMPANSFLNDVVALPDGGLLVTHMMDRHDPAAMEQAMSGALSGYVWEWHPDKGLAVMAGSESPFPNGIQISADGRYVFLNIYIVGEVWKLERSSGKRVGTVKIPGPDNSQWADDGRLLVASHTGLAEYDVERCTGLTQGYCPLAFQVVALDPDSLATEILFQHDGSAPMGAGTVALQVGDQLFIGSFAGDRLYRIKLPGADSNKSNKRPGAG